jgi:ribosomal protein S6
MNTYELMLIINPQLTDAEVGEAVENQKVLTDEGRGPAEDRSSRKKFSTPSKHRDGFTST